MRKGLPEGWRWITYRGLRLIIDGDMKIRGGAGGRKWRGLRLGEIPDAAFPKEGEDFTPSKVKPRGATKPVIWKKGG